MVDAAFYRQIQIRCFEYLITITDTCYTSQAQIAESVVFERGVDVAVPLIREEAVILGAYAAIELRILAAVFGTIEFAPKRIAVFQGSRDGFAIKAPCFGFRVALVNRATGIDVARPSDAFAR